MLWDPFLYCINDSIQGNSETGNKVFVLPSKVAINIRMALSKENTMAKNVHLVLDERATIEVCLRERASFTEMC